VKDSLLYNNPKKFIISYAAGWTVWAVVQSAIIHRLGIGWEEAIKDSLISATLFGITCLAPIILYRYYQPSKKNKVYRLFIALGTSVLFCTLFRWSVPLAFSENDPYLGFLEASMPLRFVISFLMTGFITMLNWMWSTLQEQKEFEKRRNEAEQLMKDAELSSLRQQLQPHFLFNSLNSISALAGSKPTEARKMIQQLSDFLRGTLKKDEQKIVSLREELEHLGLYLEIEKVRFGHRLNIEIGASEESTDNTLPPLLLQPIVENAIKFGLYDTTGQITISISTWLENNYLNIEVKNPFDPKTQNTNQGTGFGLNSIQRRLLLLYGRNDLLGTEKKETIFITRLKIPQLS
jgi:two-component system LytT family sensor kinase